MSTMMTRRHWLPAAGVLLLLAALGLPACLDFNPSSGPIPDEEPDAVIDVSGVFRYTGSGLFQLSGTIEFEQERDRVRCVNTTYDFGMNRPLKGEADLQGNRLEISLVPTNGDADYRVDVVFLFGDNGDTFAVEFSDTNGDAGHLGSFSGQRQP